MCTYPNNKTGPKVCDIANYDTFHIVETFIEYNSSNQHKILLRINYEYFFYSLSLSFNFQIVFCPFYILLRFDENS